MAAEVVRFDAAETAPKHQIVPDRKKIAALDGVRGIAVLLVMASHFERFIPLTAFTAPIKAVATYGWIGVALFFALSGFLITGILVETRTSKNYFSAFYARRTLRIFPIYYLTLIAVFLAATYFPAGLNRVPVPAERPLYFLYLSNWIPAFTGVWPPNVIGHFWSLAVEEQFYLVWPLVVLLLPNRWLKRAIIGLAGSALVIRVVWLVGFGTSPGIDLSTVTRMDGLALGSLGALFFLEYRDSKKLRLGWWAGLTLAGFAAGLALAPGELWRTAFRQTIGYSLLSIGFAALVTLIAFQSDAGSLLVKVFNRRSLRRVGLYSYGMYVYHVPVLGLMEILLFDKLPVSVRGNVAFALAYVVFLGIATFLAALVSYEVLERRVLAFKKYFVPASLRRIVKPPTLVAP